MLGTYAPGSTFKVITTAALLRDGLNAPTPSSARKTLVVDGKTFKNFEGEEAGAATFADDFAISCNTAFVSLSGRLPATALGKVAKDYGLGRKYTLSTGAAPSQVPAGQDKVSRAAAMIGQDRITASPLASPASPPRSPTAAGTARACSAATASRPAHSSHRTSSPPCAT